MCCLWAHEPYVPTGFVSKSITRHVTDMEIKMDFYPSVYGLVCRTIYPEVLLCHLMNASISRRKGYIKPTFIMCIFMETNFQMLNPK